MVCPKNGANPERNALKKLFPAIPHCHIRARGICYVAFPSPLKFVRRLRQKLKIQDLDKLTRIASVHMGESIWGTGISLKER
jgi:hypothetical protein